MTRAFTTRPVAGLTLWLVVGGCVAAVVLIAVALSAAGFRAFIVSTPSMGTALPVGSVVVTHPEPTYRVGEVITFTVDDRHYTHRVVAVAPDGYTTQGDINGAVDPWTVSHADVIGASVWSSPHLGWLITALPWLLAAGVLLEGVLRLARTRRHQRWWLRIAGGSVIVAVVGAWLRPWFNMVLLSWTPNDDATGILMRIVNTGIFPLNAEGTTLASGQDAVVQTTTQVGDRFILTPHPALTDWQWALVGAICLIPVVVIAARTLIGGVGGAAPGGTASRRILALGAGAVTATAMAVVAVLVLTSSAAFTATVTNSANIAGTNASFTCLGSITGHPAASTYAAYRLGDAARPSGAAGNAAYLIPDLSGNGRTGSTTGPTSNANYTLTNSYDNGTCVRDTRSVNPAGLKHLDFSGAYPCINVPGTMASPNDFALEIWVRSSGGANRRIMGFTSQYSPTGTPSFSSSSGPYRDRMLYFSSDGRLVFGVLRNGQAQVIATSSSLLGSDFHHVVATMSSTQGMALYVDGALVGTLPAVTDGHSYTGAWQIGCGAITGWPGIAGSNQFFTGRAPFAAIYTTALTPQQVLEHYRSGIDP